jgi:hypothetical protein
MEQQLKQTAKESGMSFVKGVILKPIDAVGKVSESATNVAVTTGKVAESTAKISLQITEGIEKNVGELTDKAGQIAIHATNAGLEATKAITNVVELGKKLTSAASELASRTENSIKEANARRAEIEAQKTAFLKETASNKNAVEIAAELRKYESAKQQIENDFLAKTKQQEHERLKIEADSEKFKKEFENVQIIQLQNQKKASINTYIGTKFGYKDSDFIKSGFKKFNNKGYFYMLNGIVDNNGKLLNVKFNKDDQNNLKDGYYTVKDGYVYKIVIIPKYEIHKRLLSNKNDVKELPSKAKIIHVNYIPTSFSEDGFINSDNNEFNPQPDPSEYELITKQKYFSYNSHGGNSKKKNKITRKQKNKITRKHK